MKKLFQRAHRKKPQATDQQNAGSRLASPESWMSAARESTESHQSCSPAASEKLPDTKMALKLTGQDAVAASAAREMNNALTTQQDTGSESTDDGARPLQTTEPVQNADPGGTDIAFPSPLNGSENKTPAVTEKPSDLGTSRGQQQCDACEHYHAEVWFCRACDLTYCNRCWDEQLAHKKRTNKPGVVAHEKTNSEVAEKISNVLSPSIEVGAREELHRGDDLTAWFGELPCLLPSHLLP